MKTKTRKFHFSAKLRQYRHLAKHIEGKLRDGSFRLLSQNRQRTLLRKLKERLQKIAPVFATGKMKNALAGIAMLMATAGGAQSFAPPVTSPFGLPEIESGIIFSTFADLDNDGDLDFFVVQFSEITYGQNIVFYENSGTPEIPVFSGDNFELDPFGIQFNNLVTTPNFIDLDNDGDLDLMFGAFLSSQFFFLENTGTAESPAFGAAQVSPFGLSSNIVEYNFPTFVDLDDDGDLDMFSTTYEGASYYFKNTGTAENPSFASPVANPFGINSPVGFSDLSFPGFSDFDNDGDQDLLISESDYGVEFQYYENTGTPELPAFTAPEENPFGLNTGGMYSAVLSIVDLDNDGDFDILANDFEYDDEIWFMVFFENLDVVNPLPPTSEATSIDIDEDEQYAFSSADFPFFDGNVSDQLQAVQVSVLPTAGSFTLNGTPVAIDQTIDAVDLTNCQYVPNPNEFGDNYDEFQFKVSDGGLFSLESFPMTINVAPVNDLPVSDDAEINMLASETYAFSTVDFPFTDVDDGDVLSLFQVVETVDKGTLAVDGTEVADGQVLSPAELAQLTFTPISGEEGLAYTSFQFKVSDGQVFNPTEYTLTINITGPNAASELELDAEVRLSPNPASDVLQLMVMADQPFSDLKYAVFYENGKQIETAKFAGTGTVLATEVSVADYPAGVYFVKIFADGKMKTLRFVKQ